MNHEAIVRRFFRDYESLMNDALATTPRGSGARLRNSFADYVVGADPNGVHGGRNGLLFRMMMRRGISAYRRMGTRSMKITGMEVTTLDDFHAMARTDWLASYDGRRGDGKDIAFTNLYLLQIRGGDAKIFAWITPDEQAALKAHGLAD